ncbi:LCP family protein [Sporosarcina sp. Te-1]|uniref:LCP family protein n=1 Tax=Sporosarcina sp. Te-1 TaxID=2818390 RepID=UPI001A9CCD7D|nr:LCP family protein [Sporosarcina sp. Te-1]QTD42622.1 LCP family protein [Sporosarcina sp. Te-1]
MEDKRFEGQFTQRTMQELRFTKEDRSNVFEQIHKMEEKLQPEKKTRGKLVPLTVSVLMMSLCIILFIPSILQGNVSNINSGTASNDVTGPVAQNNPYFTALFSVKDEENRVPVNLLLSYNKDKKILKVLSIPRDTYAPIVEKDGTTSYEKMTFAYVNGAGGAESVKTTVSKLFDIPIDYNAVMDLETFSTMIDSVNGIEYDLQENIRVRAISSVAFEFQRGTNHLNGEEVLALLMDATTSGNSYLDEKDLLNLIRDIINKTKNDIPPTQLKQFTTKTEGNILMEQLLESEMELSSVKLVSLKDGMKNEMIDKKYYITFEKDFLHGAAEELTTFN